MNVIQNRHAFWNGPRPMLTNRPYRTIPLSMGRQFIGFGNSPFRGPFPGPFLGDDRSLNRLENLSIPVIQSRILITPPLEKYQAMVAEKQAKDQRPGGFRGRGHPTPDPLQEAIESAQLPNLTPDEKTVLTTISMDPTKEEMEDLALIDGFFSNSLTRGICDALKNPNEIRPHHPFGRGAQNIRLTLTQAASLWLTKEAVRGTRSTKEQERNVPQEELDTVKDNSFFCGTPKGYPNVLPPWGTPADWFGIDSNQAWGNIKLQVKNALIIMNEAATFPFPPPIDQYVGQWWSTVAPDLKNLVKIGSPVDPGAVRMWITLSVAANYSDMVDRIQAELKRKAKKAKRKALMKAIGLALLSIVAMIALPAGIALAVSAIQTIVTTYEDVQKRKKAAKDIMEAAKMFEKDAPAYAAELEKTAKILDESAAIQAAKEAPSPEVQAAIDEVAEETPSTGISPLIPGGIAAAGLAAFLIFR